MPHPLHAVLDRIAAARAAGRLPVVVYDLDSTLIRNGGRRMYCIIEVE